MGIVMKSILMSIQPKWVAKILNGEKTIEIRKIFPKDYRGWVYIYCTKDRKDYLIQNYPIAGSEYLEWKVVNSYFKYVSPNGYVVARFYCDNVEEITPFEEYESPFGMAYKLKENKIVCCQKAQLTYDEYNHYLKGKTGYAIHISQLEIFDEPKELWEFCGTKKYFVGCGNIVDKTPRYAQLHNAPQSWQYIEVNE